MADATLINQLLTAQVQGVPSSGGNRTATGIPPAILSLAVGSFLNGTVLTRDGKGNAVIRTEKGDINLKTELTLKTGSELVLRIENTGEQLKLRIVTVDGKVPQTPAPTIPTAGIPTDTVDVPPLLYTSSETVKQTLSPNIEKTIERNAQSPQPSGTLSKESEEWFPGTLLKNTPDPKIAVQLPLPLRQAKENSPLLIRVVPAPELPISLKVSQAISQQQSTAGSSLNIKSYDVYSKADPLKPAPGVEVASARSAPFSAPASPVVTSSVTSSVSAINAAPASTIVPSSIQADVLSASPASAPAPASAPDQPPTLTLSKTLPKTSFTPFENSVAVSQPAAATPSVSVPSNEPLRLLPEGRMEALVLRREETGHSLIQTPLGLARVKLPENIPPQSRITVEIRPAAPAPVTVQSATLESPSSIAALLSGWTSLQEVTTVLMAENPAFAASLSQRILPHADEKLSSSLLFFVSALKGGNVKEWIGHEAVDLLEEKGHARLLQRLTADFATLRNLFTEPTGDNWQTLVFPVVYQGEMQQVQWHMRREAATPDKPEQQGTRFIVELSLSQLGAMQMDGLVRHRQNALAFDLIVRTTYPLPQALQTDISRIFTEASELTRFQGSIAYQVMWNFPIRPMATQQGFSDAILA